MGWFKKRRAKKEFNERWDSLEDEDKQMLLTEEKTAYLGVAKKLVSHRGRINAVKDFPTEVPIPEEDIQEAQIPDIDPPQYEEEIAVKN